MRVVSFESKELYPPSLSIQIHPSIQGGACHACTQPSASRCPGRARAVQTKAAAPMAPIICPTRPLARSSIKYLLRSTGGKHRTRTPQKRHERTTLRSAEPSISVGFHADGPLCLHQNSFSQHPQVCETLSVLPSLDTTHPPAAFPCTTRHTSPASPPSGRQTHSRGS